MNDIKTIDILNELIQINNERILGYQMAMDDTEEDDLKLLFNEFSITSRRLNDELIDEVENMDGEPIEGISTSSKLYRIWMDVKSAIISKDRAAILNCCEYGEDWAVKTYQKVIQNGTGILTIDQIEMVRDQLIIINNDHETIKELRDQVSV